LIAASQQVQVYQDYMKKPEAQALNDQEIVNWILKSFPEIKEVDLRLIRFFAKLSSDQLAEISQTISLNFTTEQARTSKNELDKKTCLIQNEVEEYHKSFSEDSPSWNSAFSMAQKWLETTEAILKKENEIYALNVKLEPYLDKFKVLSQKLFSLIGLQQGKELGINPNLDHFIWPFIESARDQQITRLLFEQIAPSLDIYLNKHKSEEILNEKTDDQLLFTNFAQFISKAFVTYIPSFVCTYRVPITHLLTQVYKVKKPTEKEVKTMDQTLRERLIFLGEQNIDRHKLIPFLKIYFESYVINDQQKIQEVTDLKSKNFETFVNLIFNRIKQSNKKNDSPRLSPEIEQKEIFDILLSVTGIHPTSEISEKKFAKLKEKHKERVTQKAQLITHELNQYLRNIGKNYLKAEDISSLVSDKITKNFEDQKEEINKRLNDEIIPQIQKIVTTPEEIAYVINDAIPGATDIHSLVEPQLQALLTGEEESLKDGRLVLERFIEGLIMKYFAKIIENHFQPTQTITEVITEKLAEMTRKKIESVQNKDKGTPELANELMDELILEILKLKSPSDLVGIPIALQELVYTKLKKQIYEHATPFLFPLIEREQQRARLIARSESKFLSDLSQSLSKDLFQQLPYFVNDYYTAAKKICEHLNTDDEQLINQFAQAIAERQKSKSKNLTNRELIQIYAQVTNKNEEKLLQDHLSVLKEIQANELVKATLMTPEKIVDLISQAIDNPKMSDEFKTQLTAELNHFIQPVAGEENKKTVFIQWWLDGVILQIFNRIVEKYPPLNQKDSVIRLVETLLKEMEDCYSRSNKPNYKLDVELVKAMQKVIGLDSKEFFAGLPPALQEVLRKFMTNKITQMIKKFKLDQLNVENSTIQEAHKSLDKIFYKSPSMLKNDAELVINDITELMMTAMPSILVTEIQKKDDKNSHVKGVNLVGKIFDSYLEKLVQNGSSVAQLLLKYQHTEQLEDIFDKKLKMFANPKAFLELKQKGTELLNHLLVVPLNQAVTQVVTFENKHGTEFNCHLMTNILKETAEHMQFYNQAVKAKGKEEIEQKDFVKAAGIHLHQAVPQPANYKASCELISSCFEDAKLNATQIKLLEEKIKILVLEDQQGIKRLTNKYLAETISFLFPHEASETVISKLVKAETVDPLEKDKKISLKELIRQEARAPERQRSKFYTPAIKKLLKMFFPNGKADLNFLPEEIQGVAWDKFKHQLMPSIVPMLTELFLDPVTIRQMISSSLKIANEKLNERVELTNNNPRKLDALDQAAAALCLQTIEMMDLPIPIKRQIIDSKTGQLTNVMKQTIGDTLRDQFNDTFIQDKLKLLMNQAAGTIKNNHRDPMIKFDPTLTPEQKRIEDKKNIEKLDKQNKKYLRQTVNSSISRYIRLKWKEAQQKFDHLVEKVLGKVGSKLKQGLDLIFNFIFFKLIGTLLTILIWPFKEAVKAILYRYINLDKNYDHFMNFLTRKPTDQSTATSHVVYQENLVYKIIDAIFETVEEQLSSEVHNEGIEDVA